MSDSGQYTFATAILVGSGLPGGGDLRGALLDHAESVLTAETAAAASRLIRRNPAELVVVREDVRSAEALAFIEQARTSAPACRVVVVAKEASVELAVEFVRAGACDYIAGPLDGDCLDRLVQGVRREITDAAGRRAERFFCEECPPGVRIVGRSKGLVDCLRTIRRVSESRCNPVLLLGETGTGKELAARAVHAWRCGDPETFVAVNCAALTANLLESELFGHAKGAFTGADREKTGLFELAGSGSIFLDEISEMPAALQAKLLRVLQERTFRKVGGTKDLTCDATIIASSNRGLLAEVEAGRFRRDLYYRLAVFPITLPALRSADRRADIPLLAAYFAETSDVCPRNDVTGLHPAAEEVLLAHDWPGNVRELRNVIDRAMILARSERIGPEDLVLDRPPAAAPDPPAQPREKADVPNRAKDFSLETAEREFIVRALKETGWQRTRAAALLGITRATLHAKLKRYEIQPPDSPDASDASRAASPEPLASASA